MYAYVELAASYIIVLCHIILACLLKKCFFCLGINDCCIPIFLHDCKFNSSSGTVVLGDTDIFLSV